MTSNDVMKGQHTGSFYDYYLRIQFIRWKWIHSKSFQWFNFYASKRRCCRMIPICRILYWGKYQMIHWDSNSVPLYGYMWIILSLSTISLCMRAWKIILCSTYIPIPLNSACVRTSRVEYKHEHEECSFYATDRSVEWDETIPTERFIKIIRGRFVVVVVVVMCI